jgi:ATP-binding cassette subfamily B protein
VRLKDIKTFTRQHDQSDCGVACLHSIIRFHGGEIPLERLREISGTSRQGTTLLGLFQAASQVGFNAKALEAEGIHNLKELSQPAILHVVMQGKLLHYVIYYGENSQGKLLIGDPAFGLQLYEKQALASIWNSRALLTLTPTGAFVKADVIKKQRKAWISHLIKEDILLLTVASFLGIITAILGISTAIFSQKLIDNILPSKNIEKLILSLALVALLLIVRAGLVYLRSFFVITQGRDFNLRITESFYSSLLHLPKMFFDTRKVGELVARLNDTRRIQTVISFISGNMLIDFLALLVSLAFLFIYSWMIALVLLISIPLYFLAAYYFNKGILTAQREVMSSYALSESQYIDSIQGIAVIKNTNKEQFFEKLNKNVYSIYQQKSFVLGKISITFNTVSEVAGILILLIVFSLSSFLVLNKGYKVGELVAILSISGSVLPMITRLIVSSVQLQEARVAFERMFEFVSIKPEYESKQDQEKISNITGLRMHNLSFRFPGRKLLLKNVSLEVRKGEMVALMGESGNGKSTVIQLLQKFYKPESGHILVNDTNIESIDTHCWRRQLGVVPQDVKLFNGTVLFNILLSDSPEEGQEAIAFCKQTKLSQFFEALPQGYMTIVGEEGINLSGGQKQFLALARVLWRKPSVLLLDEFTSAMDKKTEKTVLDIIVGIKQSVCTLLVTHKSDIAQLADRVYSIQHSTLSLISLSEPTD